MVYLCVGFLAGVVLLVVSLVTLDFVGVAIGLTVAIVFGVWVWLTRRDFTP